LGTGQHSKEKDSELLRNQYVVGIPHYSVVKRIDAFER